jgi:FkbM family methyltransferase
MNIKKKVLEYCPNFLRKFLVDNFTNRGKLCNILQPLNLKLVCIDIGAAYFPHLQWWLPRDLPCTRWIAVDPISENLSYLDSWPFRSRPKSLVAAIGKTSGESSLFITPIDSGSSMLMPIINQDLEHRIAPANYYFPYKEKSIFTKSISQVMADVDCTSEDTFFLKIDTQGTELEILQGAIDFLRERDIVLIEVESSFQADTFYEGAAKFWMVCQFLEGHGFELIGQNLIPFLGNGNIKIPQNTRMALNESDGIFILRRSVSKNLDITKRCAILLGYITYNYFHEALALLESDQELQNYLGCFRIRSDKLIKILEKGI